MDKKKIIVVVLACCALLAAAILLTTRTQNLSSIPELKGQVTWVKCNNPDCGISYEMPLKDYYELVDKKERETGSTGVPPIVCKKCGKESLFMAVKCEKCGDVFFYGFRGPGDYADRCPKCGFSKLEETAKQGSTKR